MKFFGSVEAIKAGLTVYEAYASLSSVEIAILQLLSQQPICTEGVDGHTLVFQTWVQGSIPCQCTILCSGG